MDLQVIVCIGITLPPSISASLQTLILNEKSGYIARLVDAYTAMIFVDGDHIADWAFWTAAPKSSAATRRIPIVLVSDQAQTRASALRSGADFVISHAALNDEAPRLIREYARVLSAETLAALACDCEAPLPPDGYEGIARFNAGEYYKQHDLFEALWVQTESPVRDLYRAILQVGVAYYQIERGNYRGAVKMLLRSVQWLNMLPDVCQGVDVAQLRSDSAQVRAALESLGESGFDQFDRALLRPVRLIEPDAPH